MTRFAVLFGFLLFVESVSLPVISRLEAADAALPHWIWSTGDRGASNPEAGFTKSFVVPQEFRSARLLVMADDSEVSVELNATTIGRVPRYEDPVELNVMGVLKPGKNNIALSATGGGVAAAVAVKLAYQTGDSERYVVSDPSWESRTTPTVSLGIVAARPWLISQRAIEINPFDDYTQWKRALGASPDSEPGKFQGLPGFEVQLIRAAAAGEGSWVSLVFDPQGRLVIAREDKGLLRMTLDDAGDQIAKVETINDTLLECRGLLFAHDSLYANANNSKALYRLRDTDGDDQFETVDPLYASSGGVGHGRNDLALGPDHRIYSIHGDSVDLPTALPDRTSPFREQRRGANTREGHVIRLNADGSEIELVTAGLRNPFGIDFNTDGEMFTYDADAEHDMGAPWYRPTRINQLVPGGDFGWRGVTGNWPPYFPDHPDNALPTLDIGKGSPTAIRFGHGSGFPAPYREALYILDWAYGRVLAVHLVPRGAGYFGRAEPFLRGRPLNVTDLDFGPDGAMYLVTGGRKTQSALYRVRYAGEPRSSTNVQPTQTAQQSARMRLGAEARQQRRALEALHQPIGEDAVDRVWRWLGSDDPQLSHAARIAIEHQPLDTWKTRALAETQPATAIVALMALARSGDPGIEPAIVDRLKAFPLERFSRRRLQMAVYTYQRCLAEDAKVARRQKRAALAKLDALYPHPDFDTHRIVGETLVLLGSPSVVEKTLERFANCERQDEQMQCLHVLRQARRGWSPRTRQLYFSALRQSEDYLGGQGMPGFIQTIRKEAVASLSDSERQQLGSLVEARPAAAEPIPGPPRTFVPKWTVEALEKDLKIENATRDLARGQRLFRAALCARCHRLGTTGRSVGPELTSVAQRFSPRDLLREIIEPSATIAENYGRRRITTTTGKTYEGQVIFSGDYRSPVLKLAVDPMAPTRLTEILKADIESSQPSPQSFMPVGLLDTLNRQEVLDLLAFLRSGGRMLADAAAN